MDDAYRRQILCQTDKKSLTFLHRFAILSETIYFDRNNEQLYPEETTPMAWQNIRQVPGVFLLQIYNHIN